MHIDLRRRYDEASLALRIALQSAILGLVLIAMGGALGLRVLSQELDNRSSKELQGKYDLVVHAIAELRTVDDVINQRERLRDLLTGHDLALTVSQPIGGTELISVSPTERTNDLLDDPYAADGETLNQGDIQFVSGSTFVKSGEALRVVLSINRGPDAAILRNFTKAAVLGMPILLIVVAVGAWVIARTSMAPLARFTRLASSMNSKTLARRLDLRGFPAELSELAQDFNAMLARIDDGVTKLGQFSADLAHELQTPVAILIGRSQVALSRQRSSQELQEVLASNIEELERLTRLISDMLFLAYAERGDTHPRKEPVDLAGEALRVAKFFEIYAEEQDVAIVVTGQSTARVDRLLIERSMINLVSNAIRHADRSSQVIIGIEKVNGSTEIAVTNSGPVIPTEHQLRLFDRFYRVDQARARSEGGTGLGLAIVQSIAVTHGGRVSVESVGRRTTFRLVLPSSLPEAQ